jgi:hypothetical protein
MCAMKVAALRIGAEPQAWRELGFAVDGASTVALANARVELSDSAERGAIASWALEGENVPAAIDGLVTEPGPRGESEVAHPNGALEIDHVVVVTPSLERTSGAFAEIGVDCRRVREAGEGVRQGFFLVTDLLVEVVESAKVDPGTPARFWGITVAVSDIDVAAHLLGERLGPAKEAVQPGRRIATVRSEAAGGLPLALITQRERGSG